MASGFAAGASTAVLSTACFAGADGARSPRSILPRPDCASPATAFRSSPGASDVPLPPVDSDASGSDGRAAERFLPSAGAMVSPSAGAGTAMMRVDRSTSGPIGRRSSGSAIGRSAEGATRATASDENASSGVRRRTRRATDSPALRSDRARKGSARIAALPVHSSAFSTAGGDIRTRPAPRANSTTRYVPAPPTRRASIITGAAPHAPPGPSMLRSAMADASQPCRTVPARSENASTTMPAPPARRRAVSVARVTRRNAAIPRTATGTTKAVTPCARKSTDATSAPVAPHLFL